MPSWLDDGSGPKFGHFSQILSASSRRSFMHPHGMSHDELIERTTSDFAELVAGILEEGIWVACLAASLRPASELLPSAGQSVEGDRRGETCAN
jgi:hypothetical protein